MLGSILIQPQMLDRMHGRGVGDEMADEIVAIAHQLSLDPTAAEAVLPAFQAAGQRRPLYLAQASGEGNTLPPAVDNWSATPELQGAGWSLWRLTP